MASPIEKAQPAFGRDISAGVFKKFLLYLFLLGLIVRAGYMVEHAHAPSFGVLTLDQKYYDTAARMLLAGGDLHSLHGLRPLLYPMFLAAIYKLGGAHGIDLAVAAQHFLGVLTGLLVALIGARLFRHRLSGLAGGVLYMLAPVPLYFEGELLIESSYVFLVCAGLLFIIGTDETAGRKAGLRWLLCGAFTVLTAQERPNILVFMAVYPLLAGWHWLCSRRPAALVPLAGLIGGLLMAVAWGFVNRIQSDHFQMIPSAGGVNLYLGNKRTADGMEPEQERRVTYGARYEDSVEIWARQEYEAAMVAQGRTPDTNPMAISQYWAHRAVAEIEGAPARWLRLIAKKTWLMFWNAEVPNNKSFAFLRNEFVWLQWLPVRWVVLLLFAPAGIWAAAKWGNRGALFILLAYVAIYSAATIIFFICDRYRYPVWPAMAVMAGGGLMAFLDVIRRRQWSGTFWLAGSMALMAAISLPNWFDAKLPSFARDYLFQSIAWYEKGHFPEALADINHSLALDPDEVTALHQRGNVLLALGKFDDAGQDYERTLKLDPADAGVWNNYGGALDGLGRTGAALEAYQHAAQCHPPSESAFLGIAFDQIKSARLDAAAAALDQLEKVNAHPNAIALALRSVLALKRGAAAQATAFEQQARAIDPAAAKWAIDRATTEERDVK